ncbi:MULTISPECIES: hypothetical protein [unclassified Cyanobium]|uniref:hypothetical protein n=1 Tax=unclassified Cyanobium TaxID=2627006 RepID=UPI0020CE0A26|nr:MULTISPECIES: hypothetical protein [unclassified Cyanobium]MCP9834948.1 hypothetical protein [Cyanobium sp. La Preciosa 7G6]MCP9937711.1 hypothetical protein [Cyanobium sp. Aljojuca 7A6]
MAPRPWPILPLNNGTFIGVFADQAGLEGSLNFRNSGANDLNVALNVELETFDQFSLYAGGGSFRSNVNELSYGGGVRWRFGGAPRAAATPSIRGLW